VVNVGREEEEGKNNSKPPPNRALRHPRSQSSIKVGVSRTLTPKRESDFLSVIRTSINLYYGQIDSQPEGAMFNIEAQRDMARNCVLEIDGILALWRSWRQSKK